MTIKVDPELLEKTKSYKKKTSQIHEQFLPEKHSLAGGVYARGDASARLEPPSQWLTFGGGATDDVTSSGVVDAFTAMKKKDDYYNIEGDTGNRVAMQLKKGEKIRVGRNGEILSYNLKISKNKVQMDEKKNLMAEAQDALVTTQQLGPPPLSWDGQIQYPGTKVIEPRKPKNEGPKPSLCENHPVVFQKLLSDEPLRKPPVVRKHGFQVQRRSKSRTGMDGAERENITDIAIDSRKKEEEERIKGLVLDDIIKIKTQRSPRTPRNLPFQIHLESRNNGAESDEGGEEDGERQDDGEHSPKSHGARNGSPQSRRGAGRSPSPPNYRTAGRSPSPTHGNRSPSPYGRDFRSPSKLSMADSSWSDARAIRPSTAMSAFSGPPDPNLRIFTPAAEKRAETRAKSRLSTPASNSRVRTPQSIRPRPGQPLHKSGAAAGASISSHGQRGDPEYIQITQQINVSGSKPSDPTTLRSLQTGVTPVKEHTSQYDEYAHIRNYRLLNEGFSPVNTPASSDMGSHHKYDVNIPSGDSGSMSDINSISDDFGDRGLHVTIQEPISEEGSGQNTERDFDDGMQSDIDDSFHKHFHDEVTLDPEMDSAASMLDDAGLESPAANDRADDSSSHLENGSNMQSDEEDSVSLTEEEMPKVTAVSLKTKELIKEVTRDPIENPPEVTEIIAKATKPVPPEPVPPAEELKSLREQIKSDLQVVQQDAQRDIQDLYLKHEK
ncbi:uncharacterized protein LOC106177871 isoform X2 [Lingula anatina]|nr:uncharacterized protein LOC106177871 isoform X2 [Lingula anatina]|eukprot:XP_013416236.1 uncharacterized protein LOC106177871 isoform X2 [Lingula anatina]